MGHNTRAKYIKRNVLRFMGVDLPDKMLDDAHDFKFVRKDGEDMFQFKTKAEMQMKGWRGVYGS